MVSRQLPKTYSLSTKRCPNVKHKKMVMAKKVTSEEVATKASKLLLDKRTSKATKSVAGSALSQKEKR